MRYQPHEHQVRGSLARAWKRSGREEHRPRHLRPAQTVVTIAVARAFARRVVEALPPEELAQVRAYPANDPCCLTHEYLNAGQLMLAAFEQVARQAPSKEWHYDLMDRAWNLARIKDWYLERKNEEHDHEQA